MERSYALLEIKSLDDDRRIISGMASTPTPDRMGDIVEPLGIKAAPDIPLFLYHDSTKVVGRVQFGAATSKGVPFTATVPKIAEAGSLRDRIEEAWQMVKYRLITGVSIGFRPLEGKVERLKSGGLHFLETEVLELSLVPVPANAEATIESVKSVDLEIRRARARAKGETGVVYLHGAPRRAGCIYLD
jgi:HK97 family phage prohead protease